MTPLERILKALEDHGCNPRPSSKGYTAHCPAHDDRRPSLSVGEGDDGRVLVHCFANCSTDAICEALGLRLPDLMPPNEPPRRNAAKRKANGERRELAYYDYRDESGKLLFQVVRYEPKDFRQRRPKDGGGWDWSVKGVRVVPYRLPELLAEPTRPVYVVEGEKDVDNLARLGAVATCNAGGAEKWTAEHAAFLRGRHVVVLPDNDEAGQLHAQQVARTLHGAAASVKIIKLPKLPPKGDVSDWIATGGTAEDLKWLADGADEWEPTPEILPGPVLTCLGDVEPRDTAWLWPGRIPLRRLTLLVGRPGEGKSFLTTDMAARVTTGTPWPDGSPCPSGSVILISAEDDPADTIRPRLDAHYADVRRVHLLSAVRQFEKGKHHERMVTLSDLDAIEEALQRVSDCKLVVVDPVGSYIGARTDAHRDNEVRGVLAPIALLAEKYGAAVVVVAHRRKSGGNNADDLALGSRAFTGIARAVWHLVRDSENKLRRVMLPGKNNLAPEGGGLAFTIAGDPARITWERDPVMMSADDALAGENGGRSDRKPGPDAAKRNLAADWLRELLQHGPMEVSKVKEEVKQAGHSWRTMHRAKDEIGVRPYRLDFSGPWYWRLPADATCHALGEESNLAFWHDSENTSENVSSEPGTMGTCQDDSTWHERNPAAEPKNEWGVIE